MKEWWGAKITSLLMWMFVWSGSKLFAIATIYIPDGEEGNVHAMHYAISDEAFLESCRDALKAAEEN